MRLFVLKSSGASLEQEPDILYPNSLKTTSGLCSHFKNEPIKHLGRSPAEGSGEAQATQPHCHQFLSLTVLCGLQKQRGWDTEERNTIPLGSGQVGVEFLRKCGKCGKP